MPRFLLSVLFAMFAWAPAAKAQLLFLTSFENAAYGVGAAWSMVSMLQRVVLLPASIPAIRSRSSGAGGRER